MDSCQAQLEAAKENEIPVVAFDSNVSEKKLVKAYQGTDNVQVGKMAAYQLGSALGKMGKVAVFSAQQKTKSVQDRVDGFMNNIRKYGDIEVVEVIYSDQVDDMETSMKEVLDKYPHWMVYSAPMQMLQSFTLVWRRVMRVMLRH